MKKDELAKISGKLAEWSLYFLVFSIPFSKSMVEICITVALVSWIIKKVLTGDFKIKITPLNILIFAFLAANLLSFVNADFRMLFMRAIVTKCLKFLLLYFIVVETIDSDVKFRNLLIMTLISTVIVIADAYLQYYVLHFDVLNGHMAFKYAPKYDADLNPGFPTGPFTFPNDMAAWILVVSMPLAAFFINPMKNFRLKLALGIILFPLVFLLYLTNTQAAWLGFVIGVFILILLVNKKMFMIVLMLLIVLAIALGSFLPKESIDDILGFPSIKDRMSMWQIGWRIFLQHPIIGNGLNSFFLKFQEFRTDDFRNRRGSYAHNGYLQIAGDLGIIGLVIFLLLIVRAFHSSLRYAISAKNNFSRIFTLGIACGILAFLIHSFFDTNLHSLPLVTLFWFALAVMINTGSIYGKKA